MIRTLRLGSRARIGLPVALLVMLAAPSAAQVPNGPAPTYADLADMADSSRLVVRAEVRKLAQVEPERARGVRPGHGRFYLVDLPIDGRGKPPALKKRQVLLFVRETRGQVGELQLVAPDAQVPWYPETEAQVRAILAELITPNAPPRITGVREAIHVPGNLAGEGETQFFLDTANQSAAAMTVQHVPGLPQGAPPTWGISFSEVAASPENKPRPNTLAWYRLACFLPNNLPSSANLSDTATNRAQAEADYRTILGQLGPCARNR
jgi:hypothetical protein